MTTLERIENAAKLWKLLMPKCPAPDGYNLGRWVSRFSDAVIEHGIQRTVVKFRNGVPANPTIAHRYATGVMINEQLRNVGNEQRAIHERGIALQ